MRAAYSLIRSTVGGTVIGRKGQAMDIGLLGHFRESEHICKFCFYFVVPRKFPVSLIHTDNSIVRTHSHLKHKTKKPIP